MHCNRNYPDIYPVQLGCKPFPEKGIAILCTSDSVFLLIPNMVSKNSRIHLNTLYDKKLVLANLRNFEKKIENRVGKHFWWLKLTAEYYSFWKRFIW